MLAQRFIAGCPRRPPSSLRPGRTHESGQAIQSSRGSFALPRPDGAAVREKGKREKEQRATPSPPQTETRCRRRGGPASSSGDSPTGSPPEGRPTSRREEHGFRRNSAPLDPLVHQPNTPLTSPNTTPTRSRSYHTGRTRSHGTLPPQRFRKNCGGVLQGNGLW